MRKPYIQFAVFLAVVFGGIALTAHALAPKPQVENVTPVVASQRIRFQPVEVWIDTKDIPLAAYQIEIAASSGGGGGAGNVQIVGIEGGSHKLFTEPPYYDPMAMQQDRVIIADFSTAIAGDLPSGRTRLVTLHLQITGDAQPDFDTNLIVAADVDGITIAAAIDLRQGSN